MRFLPVDLWVVSGDTGVHEHFIVEVLEHDPSDGELLEIEKRELTRTDSNIVNRSNGITWLITRMYEAHDTLLAYGPWRVAPANCFTERDVRTWKSEKNKDHG